MRTNWLAIVLVVLSVLLGSALCLAAEAQSPPAVEVHGWSQTRYYVDVTVDGDRDTTTGQVTNTEEDSFLKEERVSLSGLARLDKGRIAYGEVYVHPWLPNTDPAFLYLESLYLDLPVGPGAKVRLGKGRNYAFGLTPTYGNRKTSNYSPVQETFTQDRVVGLQYLQTKGADCLNFALVNSPRAGQRFIGMTADAQLDNGALADVTVPHLANRDAPGSRSHELEADMRYGHRFASCANVGVSGRVGRVDSADIAFLESRFPGETSGTTRGEYGLDATWASMPFSLGLEYYTGKVAGLGHTGWSALLGLEPTPQCSGPWNSFSSACKGLFVRYSESDIDVTPAIARPITWDTQQWAASYVYPLKFKGQLSAKWLQFEYERNTEDAPDGADDLPNNIFFAELFVAF